MLISELERRVVSELNNSSVKYALENGDYGKSYVIRESRRTFIFTIDEKWIGYVLEVQPEASLKPLGFSADTDNYPLTGEYELDALAVYDEAMQALKAFLETEIYIGSDGARRVLAIRMKQHFKVAVVGKFTAKTFEISPKDLKPEWELRRIGDDGLA